MTHIVCFIYEAIIYRCFLKNMFNLKNNVNNVKITMFWGSKKRKRLMIFYQNECIFEVLDFALTIG